MRARTHTHTPRSLILPSVHLQNERPTENNALESSVSKNESPVRFVRTPTKIGYTGVRVGTSLPRRPGSHADYPNRHRREAVHPPHRRRRHNTLEKPRLPFPLAQPTER